MKLLIYGSKDFGKLLRELVRHCGHEFVGFVDDFDPKGPDVVGTYAEALAAYPPSSGTGMVMGIGYNHLAARQKAWARARGDGFETPTLTHASAVVAPSARIGEGSILMARTIVDVFSQVDECCVLWPGAIVNHDCRIGANCFLSPGAIVLGFVNVGKSCFIGAGAIIVDHREVQDGVFVKAGVVHK